MDTTNDTFSKALDEAIGTIDLPESVEYSGKLKAKLERQKNRPEPSLSKKSIIHAIVSGDEGGSPDKMDIDTFKADMEIVKVACDKIFDANRCSVRSSTAIRTVDPTMSYRAKRLIRSDYRDEANRMDRYVVDSNMYPVEADFVMRDKTDRTRRIPAWSVISVADSIIEFQITDTFAYACIQKYNYVNRGFGLVCSIIAGKEEELYGTILGWSESVRKAYASIPNRFDTKKHAIINKLKSLVPGVITKNKQTEGFDYTILSFIKNGGTADDISVTLIYRGEEATLTFDKRNTYVLVNTSIGLASVINADDMKTSVGDAGIVLSDSTISYKPTNPVVKLLVVSDSTMTVYELIDVARTAW